MRCAACGAWNAERAEWCTQCYVALGDRSDAGTSMQATGDADTAAHPHAGIQQAPEAAHTQQGRDRSAPLPASTGAPHQPPHSTGPVEHAGTGPDPDAARDIRTRDGEVEWRCRVCHGWSALIDPACVRCGAPRHGFGSEGSAAPDVPVGPGAVLATVVLPGLGHVVTRRAGAGLARIAIFVLWAVGGIVWLLSGGDAARAPAVTLLAGAGLLWGLTLVDIVARGGRGDEPIGNRGLLWLVVAVTLGLAVAAARVGLEVVPS